MTDTSPLQPAYQAWSAGDYDTAIDALLGAVAEGVPGAWPALMDIAGDAGLAPDQAREVRAALRATPGGGEDGRLNSLLSVSGIAAAADWTSAIAQRQADAQGGDRRASLELALLALMAGETDRAVARFEALADSGSGEAVAALLRLGVQHGAVSEAAAPHAPALERAHPLGGALASAIQGLPARARQDADTGELDPAALAVALFAETPACERLHDRPRIEARPATLSPVLCDYLTAASIPFLKPAEIFDPTTGQRRPDPYRRSLTAALPPSAMDLPTMAIRTRMAALAGAGISRAEPLAILVYRPGEEYRAHYDFVTPDGARASADLERRGQRAHTVLVKLNAEHTGGATRFTRLSLDWAGARGDALVFDNLDEDGKGAKQSLHAGLPVRSGTKVLASLWIRER